MGFNLDGIHNFTNDFSSFSLWKLTMHTQLFVMITIMCAILWLFFFPWIRHFVVSKQTAFKFYVWVYFHGFMVPCWPLLQSSTILLLPLGARPSINNYLKLQQYYDYNIIIMHIQSIGLWRSMSHPKLIHYKPFFLLGAGFYCFSCHRSYFKWIQKGPLIWQSWFERSILKYGSQWKYLIMLRVSFSLKIYSKHNINMSRLALCVRFISHCHYSCSNQEDHYHSEGLWHKNLPPHMEKNCKTSS